MSFFESRAERDLRKEKGFEPATTQEFNAKVAELRAAVQPLQGPLATFCSDACLARFLRARNWNVKKATKMLKDTLAWRAQYKPEEIRWEEVAKEAETGKLYRTNFLDKKGQSVLVMAPGRQNTNTHDTQIRHLVYCLENATICLPPGTERMVWLIDFRGWTLRMSPPLKTSRETLNILQNHYPERLDVALLYNPPAVFEAFWTLIKPFMDPKTFRKVKFLYSSTANTHKLLDEHFDLDTLEQAFGGRSTWQYDHAAYGAMMREDDLKTAQLWKLPSAAAATAPAAAPNGVTAKVAHAVEA
eukprot:jgi/Mesen1/2548/ME000162S01675